MEKKQITGSFIAKDRIEYAAESVVSQQILLNSAGNITLFSFDKGQQLSEHTAPFDAVCQILDGQAEIRIENNTYLLNQGEMIIMPANKPHALYAKSQFKMLLTMIKGN
jgi:quercetin dioxygenase-like cupin family protein